MQTYTLSPEEVKSLLRKNMAKRNFRDENIDGGGLSNQPNRQQCHDAPHPCDEAPSADYWKR